MKLLKSLTTVGGFTMGSRVFGFIRDMITASLLGTGAVADALVVAIKLPSLLRRILAEGAFNAAFVPMFAGTLAKDGKDYARSFAEEVFSILIVCLLLIVVIVEFFMPWLMRIFVPGFSATPERLELAISFTRITFPFILFISLTALYSGILNSLERFAAAASSPMAGNVFIIGFVMALSTYTTDAGVLMAGAIMGCGVVQLLWVLVPAYRAGVGLKIRRPRFSPRVRQLLKRMAPVALGSGVHQVNVLIGTLIASILPVGGMSFLYYAERLNQLPLSVIGTAMSTVLLPFLAKHIRAGRHEEAQRMQNQGLELAMLLTIPAMIGLVMLAEPLVKMLFQRGAFDALAAQQTAYALMAFSLGLPAYVLTKIFNTSFYAQEDTTTPLKTAGIAVLVDIVLSLILLKPLQHVGIALATAVSAWVNVVMLGYLLYRKQSLSLDRAMVRFSVGLGISSAATALVLWVLKPYMMQFIFSGGLQRIASVSFLVASGLVMFIVMAYYTGILSFKDLKSQFKGV